jgi:hypothetical protein
MTVESFTAASGCEVILTPFDNNTASHIIVLASWVVFFVLIYQYLQKKAAPTPTAFDGYGSTYSGAVHPDIILYGVTGKMEDIVEETKEAGFLIFNALAVHAGTEVVKERVAEKGFGEVEKVKDRDLYVICLGLSPALLIKLSTIYSRSKVPDNLSVEPKERIRLAQKAEKLLETMGTFKYIRAEYLHVGADKYFDCTTGRQKSDFLCEYFGFEMSIFVTSLKFIATSLAPVGVAWLTNVILGNRWLEPILGVLFAFWMRTTVSRWRFRVTRFGMEWITLRNADDDQAKEVTDLVNKPKNKNHVLQIVGTSCVLLGVLVAQYHMAYYLEGLKNSIVGMLTPRLFLLDAAVEVVYWFASQVTLGIVNALVIPELVKMENHLLSADRDTSTYMKAAVCQVGVFVTKLAALVRLGYANIRIQEQLSVLFLVHCFVIVKNYTSGCSSLESRTERRVKKSTQEEQDQELLDSTILFDRDAFRRIDLAEQGVSVPEFKRLKSQRSEMYLNLVQAQSEAANGKESKEDGVWTRKDGGYDIRRLTPDDHLVLDELVLHTFEKNPLLLDVVCILGSAVMIASFAPLSIPVSLLCLWRMYDTTVEKLFCHCRRNVINDLRTMEPWLAILAACSVAAVALNTFTLYYFVTSAHPMPTMSFPDADGDGVCEVPDVNTDNMLALTLGLAGV